MAEIDDETLRNMARQLTEPQRLQEAAGLAGTGLQLPLVSLRAAAARRELRRIELRDGAKSPAAQGQAALVAALYRREVLTAETLARRSVAPVELSRGEAGLTGRITRDRQPLVAVSLMVLDAQDQPLRQTCTGRDGRYAVGVPDTTEVRLEVRDDGKPIYRDNEVFAYPAGYRGARDIEIAEGEPICTPTESGSSDALQMPGLVGMDLKQALRGLEGLGLKPGKIEETPSDRPGIVLDQKPTAGASITRGAEVALQVGAKDERPAAMVGDLAGQSLDTGLRRMAETGVAPASVTFVQGRKGATTIAESRASASGNALHLAVAVGEGEAAKIGVVAAVLAAGDDGKALGLASPEEASRWLEGAKVASLADVSTAAGEDDATLRKRLALEPRASVAAQRRALLTLATRIRDT